LTKQTLDDGSVIVEGKATGPDLDLDGQVIDREFARKAMREWFNSWGNIRQMHSASLPPAGKAFELDQRDDGDYIKVRVVEPTSVKLVNEGVYQAFSVGIAKPRIIRDLKRAPNGVIIDGRVVENSLVDYPANTTCKFLIAKSASADAVDEIEYVGKTVEIGKAVEADLAKCACGCTCQPGKPDPNCDCQCADCVAARSGTEAVVQKKDVDPNVGGGVDRDKLDNSDFAGPDRSFPIVTPGDVSDAASSLGRAKGDHSKIKANIIRIAHRKGDAFVKELPEDWKTDAEKGAVAPSKEVPYLLKRLHDVVCGAYHWDLVVEEYPTIEKNGVAAALGGPTRGMLYQMLTQEISEDGGSGSEAYNIHDLAGAYKALCCFLNDETQEDMPMMQMAAEAHASLHQLFVKVNEDALDKAYTAAILDGGSLPGPPPGPRPSDEIGAQRFQRPFLSGGRAANRPSGSRPSTIQQPAGLSADRFSGAEADVAKDTAPAARVYYTTDARDKARDIMAQLHDHIADVFPDLCPMSSQETADVSDAMTAPTMDMKEDSKPQAITPEDTAASPGEKVEDADVSKTAVVKIDTTELEQTVGLMIKTALANAKAEYEDRIEKLQGQIDKMASEPDPAKAPTRGMAGTIPGQTAVVEKRSFAAEAQQRERNDRIAFLQSVASGTSQYKFAAEEELRKLGVS